MRRLLAAGALAGLLVLAAWIPAAAHGALDSSAPRAGTSSQTAPREVRLHFTEAPDVRLSSIRVYDAGGREVTTGRATVPAGDRSSLAAPLGALDHGTYTVSWRAVSAVDGHLAAGSYTFGVGVAVPAEQQTAVAMSHGEAPSALAVAGRWAFFWGVALLVGAVATGAVVFQGRMPARTGLLLAVALAGSAVGLVLLIIAAIGEAGTGIAALAGSATGLWLGARALWLVGAAAFAWGVARDPLAAGPRIGLGVAAAGTLAVHAFAGHAAAPSPLRWLNLLAQWGHLVAVGLWIGGLVWLLAGLPGLGRRAQAGAALRYSRLATTGLALVLLTGTARSLDEVGGWSGLTSTSFGRVLLVKLALFGGLLVLGTHSHFLVPTMLLHDRGHHRLRRSGFGELGLATGVLGAAALLSALPPGSDRPMPMPAPAPMAAASGTDWTTSVKVGLQVSPGRAGPNHFVATVVDYDRGSPVAADRVRLSLKPDAQPDLAPLTLDLARQGDSGQWQATGSSLAMAGRWSVTAQVEQGPRAFSVPLELTVGAPGGMAVHQLDQGPAP
jgi:putative copper export protein/methionine-rich copper-binding protein CopC